MTNVMRAVLVVFIAALFSGAAVAQQAVAPPPKPADNGPSLAFTMQYIQEKLNGNGSINCKAETIDNATGSIADGIKTGCSTETTNVVADASACRINFHRKTYTYDGRLRYDKDYWLDLRPVKELSIVPLDQWLTHSGPDWSYRVTPAVFVLSLRPETGRAGRGEFYFYDEDMADRVAKALTHAVELCGGGQKAEPF